MNKFILVASFIISFKNIHALVIESENKKFIKRGPDEPMVSREYHQGEFLIYDCEKSHFACVTLDGFDQCKGKRESDRYQKKILFRCAPIKKYETQQECFDKQQELTNKALPKPFCQ